MCVILIYGIRYVPCTEHTKRREVERESKLLVEAKLTLQLRLPATDTVSTFQFLVLTFVDVSLSQCV